MSRRNNEFGGCLAWLIAACITVSAFALLCSFIAVDRIVHQTPPPPHPQAN